MELVPCEGGVALRKWRNPPNEVVVPAMVGGRRVCAILEGCSQECTALSDVRFEDGSCLKQLGNWAFIGCSSLRVFVCPRGVESIGAECFSGCSSLSNFRFEDGSCLKQLGRSAFSGCSSLCVFVCPRDVESIGRGCFSGCSSLSNFRFEDGSCLKQLGEYAFSGCRSLRVFVCPRGVESIGEGCFQGCDSLARIILERGAKIGRESFRAAGLKDGVEVVSSGERSKHFSDYLLDLGDVEEVPSGLVSGGTGSIKLFKEKGNGNLVVGKFLESDDSGLSQKTFEREISNLLTLDHPCVVSLTGYALPCLLTQYRFGVFTDYVSGGSLSDAISMLGSSRDSVSWFDSTARAVIVVGIAYGMRYVHSRGIIHRDLKPSNVLLDERHHPQLCDFGSSRSISGDFTLTQAPQVTLYYAAPEFADPNLDSYDTKVDVYSFGMMLYEIVTGQLALRHLNQFQVLGFIVRGMRPEIPGDVLPFTRSLIERCWSGAPSERPSFAEICSELAEQHFRLFEDVDSGAVASYAHSLPA